MSNSLCVVGLPAELLAELRSRLRQHHITAGHLFSLMDTDRSSTISYTEFKRGLAMTGLRPMPREHELKALFGAFDSNSDVRISWREMCQALEGGKAPRGGWWAGNRIAVVQGVRVRVNEGESE